MSARTTDERPILNCNHGSIYENMVVAAMIHCECYIYTAEYIFCPGAGNVVCRIQGLDADAPTTVVRVVLILMVGPAAGSAGAGTDAVAAAPVPAAEAAGVDAAMGAAGAIAAVDDIADAESP